MAFDLRAQRRNFYPSTALTAGTATSQTEKLTVGTGIRFYVYVSAAVAGSTGDSFSLVAMPPNGGAAIVLATFSKTGLLSTAGQLVFDFRNGQTGSIVGSGITFAAGASYAAAAVTPPMLCAIQITLGTGASATIAVDAEILP